MLPALKNNLNHYIKNIFSSKPHVKKSLKRPLEEYRYFSLPDSERFKKNMEKKKLKAEKLQGNNCYRYTVRESDDEERESSEEKPTKKKQRQSSEEPAITRSYTTKKLDIVGGMTGIYNWISDLMSPRRREPPADIGVLAYGSRARIRMDGGSMGEVEVSPEEYVRGEVSPQPFPQTDHTVAQSFPEFTLDDDDDVQFMREVQRRGDLPRGRRKEVQPSRRPPLPRVPLGSPTSPITSTGISPTFRFTPSIDLSVDKAAQHRSRESSISKTSQRPLSLRRRSEVISKNPLSSSYKPLGIAKRKIPASRFYGRGNSCAQESFRFEDKLRYQQLLQQFTKSSHGVYKSSSTTNSISNGSTTGSSADLITVSRVNPAWTKYKQQQLESRYNKERQKQQQLESIFNTEQLREQQQQLADFTSTQSELPDLSPILQRKKPLSSVKKKPKPSIPVIELSDSERSTRSRTNSKGSIESDKDGVEIVGEVKTSSTSSSLEKRFKDIPYYRSDWLKDLQKKYDEKSRKAKHEAASKENLIDGLEERRRKDASLNDHLSRSLKHLDLTHTALYKVVPAEEEDEALVELTPEMEDLIEDALIPSPGSEVLVDKFNIQITRHDISTLSGLNWLNDEVINFYMNLLVERGSANNFQSVYAFNTFFYPKLVKNGYGTVKRWTKKVDVFKYDLLLVPVHLGMHWCLASIDLKTKAVRYYDSMLGHNQQCLQTLIQYLESEHKDKKSSSYDTTGWKLEHMKEIPQQMNGSDCGMFTCKFAEYLSRGARFSFGQEDMPYFRRRMVYEIVKGKLL